MKEKNQFEKKAAERQVELLSDALGQAADNGGVWLNKDGKFAPILYPKGVTVNPFNSLMLALHSDKIHARTNIFAFFSEAKKMNIPIREHEHGVPFLFYNWKEYVNKNNPDEKISREDYLSLDEAQQKQYKGVRNREVRTMFNLDQTILPMSDEKEYKKILKENGGTEHREHEKDEDMHTSIAFNDMLLKLRDNLVPIVQDGSTLSSYDAEKDKVHLVAPKSYENFADYAQDALRQILSATGHQQRLAREGMVMPHSQAPSEDALRHEQLVVEVASAVKAMEFGLPAKLSPEAMQNVEYWQRELKENPCLIDAIESDVNNALDVIRKAERGEKITYSSVRNHQETAELKGQMPKHFYVADEIAKHPNKDAKTMVLVVDKLAKSADVILPSGASNEVDNEIPGMNKLRIEKALQKEGVDTVTFFNPDGALGFRPDDSYFADKEITVAKLKNWNLEKLSTLDASPAVANADKVGFDRIQMIQDDNKRWALFIKPEGGDAFSVYPDKQDLNRFWSTLKQANASIDNLRVELASKYYAMVESKPELKVDIFGGNESDMDLARIEKVNIFKTKDGTIYCSPTIQGVEKVEPRPMTPQQWQRMWLADDRTVYKQTLAAVLFDDVLRQSKEKGKEHTEYHEKLIEEKPTKDKPKDKPLSREEQAKLDMEKRWNNRMKTWEDLKEKHPNARLMFRVGDFYELYKQDAIRSAEVLGLTLNKHNDVDMVAFPHFSLDTYLPKLIRAGERIAICDEAVLEREQKQNDKQTETQSKGMHR